MNFAEALELHKAISVFCSKNLKEIPRIGIYDILSIDRGYFLCVKETSTSNGNLRDFLEKATQTHRLKLTMFRGYFVLDSSGGIRLSEN
ncbi:MAG: hypothetical protein NWF05_06800 [Candidatus Bathyarchaeota archaeon]|nr:hypothetical protein [Candidatus Bathyarchaeota archaeon]